MKVSIGLRLFLTVVSVSATVAVTGLFIARWQLFDDFATYTAHIELDKLQDLADTLQAQYRQHGNWSFLPAGTAQRQQWLHRELLQLEEMRRENIESSARPPRPPTYQIPEAPPAPPLPPPFPAGEPMPRSLAAPEAAIPPPPPPPPPPEMVGAISSGLFARVSVLDAQETPLIGADVRFRDRVQRPLLVNNRAVGYLAVQRARLPEGVEASEFLLDQLRNLLLTLLLCLILSAAVAALLAMHFRRPIRALAEGALALRHARFDTRIAVQRSDELGELAQTFNQLAAALQDMERSRQQWVADTSHESRTPLSVLMAQLEAMQDGVRSASADNIALLLRQTQSLNKLVNELFELAKADAGASDYDMQKMSLWPLAQEVLDSFREKMQRAGITLQCGDAPATTFILGDAQRLRQLVSNLIENSLRYTAAGGCLAIAVEVGATQLQLTLDDSAPGVPEAALAHLGERFYRVEASRSRQHGGAGLGLSLCRKIVEAHGGELCFAHSPLGGLRVVLRLPLYTKNLP